MSPTFFFSTSAAVVPRTTARSAASFGMRPETTLRFSQEKPPHSPRGHDHHLGVLDADQIDEHGAGFRDMRERSDAFDDGGAERFRRQSAAHVADDDVGAAGFHPGLPARFKTARDSDQRDDGGDADGDAHEGEPGADRPPHQSARDDGEKGHVGGLVGRVGDDAAVLHLDDARGLAGDAQVVRHQDQRHVLLAAEAHDQVEDELRVFAVEIARGFVGQQDRRRIGQAAGDGDALAFAAGKLGGKMMQPLFRVRRLSAIRGRACFRSARERCVSNIGICTFSSAVKVGSRWKAWKMKPISWARYGGEIGAIRERIAAILQSARARLVERAEHLKQRGSCPSRSGRRSRRTRLAGCENRRRATPAPARRRIPSSARWLQTPNRNLPFGIVISSTVAWPVPGGLCALPRATGRQPAGRQD